MAKSAVTSYSSLLKEISNGLTSQDVADIKLLLRYPVATTISTGTQLLVEMERQDDLDEDKLETLKDVLGKQGLKRLVKIVEKFEKASSSDTSQGDQLAQSWPSHALKEKQQQPNYDRLTQSASTAEIRDQLHVNSQRVQPVLQQTCQGAAPPASYQGNLPQDRLQQPQLTPGVGYPMQQMNPNMYLQSSPFPVTAPTPMGYCTPNQEQFSVQQQQQQQQQQMMWYQQQHFQSSRGQYHPMNPGAQAQHPVISFPPGYQPHTGTQYRQSPGGEPHAIQRVQSVPKSTSPPGGLGHAKVVPSKSCPSQFRVAPSQGLPQAPVEEEEEEVGLKRDRSNGQTTKEMNIPAENMDAGAKATGEKTVNGNIVMGTSSMAGPNEEERSKESVREGVYPMSNQMGEGVYPMSNQMGEGVQLMSNQMGEGVQLMSNQMTDTEADLLLLSGFSGKKLYDCRKVDFIPVGLYRVRIPQGVHYITTEGAFAILPFNSSYSIELGNNSDRRRCSALVDNNGKFAGEWTIDPMGYVVLERPATDEKKFHFVEASRAPSGSGVRVDDPNNGVICVTFTPEKEEPLNDLSRGLGHLGLTSNGDYFESSSMNDVQRGIAPQPDYDRQVGCTVLQGESHQQFTRSEHFQLDNAKKTTIVLKLVGKPTQ